MTVAATGFAPALMIASLLLGIGGGYDAGKKVLGRSARSVKATSAG